MKTNLIITVLFAMCATSLFAQDAGEEGLEKTPYIYDKYNNTIGAEASMLTGYGIMYKRKITDGLHIKVAGVPYYNETEYNKDIFVTVGGQVQFDVVRYPYLRGYFLLGGAYHYDNTTYHYTDTTSSERYDKGFSSGLGFGAETRLYRQLCIHGELSVGYYNTNKNYDSYYYYSPTRTGFERTITFGVGIGIGFMF
ncbi:MAG: hypothetical protein JNJ85_13495 [Candidatus Kapabacteria bacterium]|nr:hypothetical protein [Candidatus Kapabacteria bacterium]